MSDNVVGAVRAAGRPPFLADVLDQSEVDALLAAVDGGAVQKEAAPTVYSSKGTAQADVQVYDFKRPERVSKDQMRALEG
ncbi:MAG: hypothetical protein ABSF29_10985, partial [Tepidisphaeraceae bacterium]